MLRLDLRPEEALPLYRQLYEQVREAILSGSLAPGSRLPPSRRLAEQLKVARITISAAYDQLQAEGYLISKVGAGTFVAGDLPPVAEETRQPFRPQLTDWGRRLSSTREIARRRNASGRLEIDFGFGRSFPHIFPYDIWRRLLARYLSTDDTMLSRYGTVAGFEPLRQAIADYLRRMRGVKCSPEEVLVVTGMQQGLDILGRLLLGAGDQVLVETPGYADAFQLFRSFGAQLIALPVDQDGFPVELIPEKCGARVAFVTPSNQFPKGGAMPLARRLALLQWARENEALILEDDYDGELRYDSHPLAALQGLDRDGRVIYLGTFSKVLFPALRLGYVVPPKTLLTQFVRAMELSGRGAPTLTQAAVADFIAEGHFERHLRRLRKEYGRRRAILVQALNQYLPAPIEFSRDEAGLHVMLYLGKGIDEDEVVQEAAALGVGVYPGRPYHLDPPSQPSILLGFSGLSDEQIVEGVKRLASALAVRR